WEYTLASPEKKESYLGSVSVSAVIWEVTVAFSSPPSRATMHTARVTEMSSSSHITGCQAPDREKPETREDSTPWAAAYPVPMAASMYPEALVAAWVAGVSSHCCTWSGNRPGRMHRAARIHMGMRIPRETS